MIRVSARKFILLCLCLALFTGTRPTAREFDSNWKSLRNRRPPSTSLSNIPRVMYASHHRGLMQLAVASNATFGTEGSSEPDPFTGGSMLSCTYPRNDDIVYLWVGAFWIGAVVGRDTLVSTGTEDFYQNTEFWPELPPIGDIQVESIDPKSRYYTPTARSEEDIICEYTDTFTDPGLSGLDIEDNRPHRPLGVRVKQRSMAWSYAYADDFILFDYEIKNIGKNRLKSVFMGIWVDGDVWHTSRNGPEGWNDDMVGFYRSHPAPEGCGFVDTVNVAWTADADGDPDRGVWDYRSARNVVGTRVVRTPSDSLDISYNWWIINYSDPSADFGPRRSEQPGDGFRFFPSSRLGTPEGDRDKYYVLRHREFDYDLLTTALDHTGDGFLPPPRDAAVYAVGFDTRYLLSFGPFNIDPGQSLPISFAWVGGQFLHRDANSFATLFNPASADSVKQFYDALDFSNLALNSRWASWIYDNPGRDTDGDGYAGKSRICNHDSVLVRIDTSFGPADPPDMIIDTVFEFTEADTFFYEGDGVPDFQGASPPPAPYLRIIPSPGKLAVRWNGYFTETTKDPFTGKIDFEGYRVYMGLDDRTASLILLSSYDIEDYNVMRWQRLSNGRMGWAMDDTPLTLQQLRSMFGNPSLEPEEYTPFGPLAVDGERYYFEPQDHNQSNLNSGQGIHKVYPTTPWPGRDSSLWRDEDLIDGYDRPLPKYFEYEFVINNLLPTVPYYVAVTTFDFGSPGAGLGALETNPLNNMIIEFPQYSSDTVENRGLAAFVYPNPYRVDANYFENGFEGRGSIYGIPERERRIHFSNLPAVCTISIYSLDGDLIRSWEHSFPDGGPGANHDSWDMISRNTQSVVTGIYYYVVESVSRTQTGKFVIIK